MKFPHEKATEMSHFIQLLYFNHLPRCQLSTTHGQEAKADDAASDTFDGHHCESSNCHAISTVGSTAANDSQQVVIGSSEFVTIATSTAAAFGCSNANDKLGAMSEFHHHQWRPRRSDAIDR